MDNNHRKSQRDKKLALAVGEEFSSLEAHEHKEVRLTVVLTAVIVVGIVIVLLTLAYYIANSNDEGVASVFMLGTVLLVGAIFWAASHKGA